MHLLKQYHNLNSLKPITCDRAFVGMDDPWGGMELSGKCLAF